MKILIKNNRNETILKSTTKKILEDLENNKNKILEITHCCQVSYDDGTHLSTSCNPAKARRVVVYKNKTLLADWNIQFEYMMKDKDFEKLTQYIKDDFNL